MTKPTPLRAVSAARRSRTPELEDGGLAAAIERLAQAAERKASAEEAKIEHYASIAKSLEQLQPAAETLHGFGARLDMLCSWLKRKGPWILGLVPLVASAIGAISPNAAAGLKAIIAALGHEAG